MPRLSAFIIARNEAANIGECLDGLGFCDEIIVAIYNAETTFGRYMKAWLKQRGE